MSISQMAMLHDFLVENKIAIIEPEVNYWFVRSDGGDLFELFHDGNFIGIKWNKLLRPSLFSEKTTKKEAIEEIKRLYKDEVRHGNIYQYHKILIQTMKKGDIVLVPNKDSQSFLIGEISGDFFMKDPETVDYTDKNFSIEEHVYKRRPVKWLVSKPIPRIKVDPSLLSLIYSQHTIVNANSYSEFVNRALYPNAPYFKDDSLHLVVKVNMESAISVNLIRNLISPIADYCSSLCNAAGVPFDEDALAFQATVNSPGDIEIIGIPQNAGDFGTAILIVLGLLFAYNMLFGGEISIGKLATFKTGGMIKTISEALNDRVLRQNANAIQDRGKKSLQRLQTASDKREAKTKRKMIKH